ncbi:cystatin-B-like [Clupea harengus]|uniref:Cystatin-B n=1 Tax=Clupea harengus TaxID=7950 RepID=A0A6P8FHM7_CLUHA|nr:cystatin-B-like [Clupea harengus]
MCVYPHFGRTGRLRNKKFSRFCSPLFNKMSGTQGGLGEVEDVTPEIQTMCDEVKAAVEEKVGKKYDVYTAKKYKNQIVAGTNYFIKVHVGGDDYIHIRLFEMLPVHGNKRELHSIHTSKTESDEIVYF